MGAPAHRVNMGLNPLARLGITCGMSKSVTRVKSALSEAGLSLTIHETPASSRTAAEAAAVAGVALDQIVKSIILQGESGALYLFLTAGGNQVDPAKAAGLAGEPLHRADADTVRRVTGFAIGGVSIDPRLMAFATVWAAAGTPHHLFEIAPDTLQSLTKATAARFTTTPD
jgi:prolyl-tRNA editing enzyme YbaK/EbsC (Cys-tRNA(Pro) deacylase)